MSEHINSSFYSIVTMTIRQNDSNSIRFVIFAAFVKNFKGRVVDEFNMFEIENNNRRDGFLIRVSLLFV